LKIQTIRERLLASTMIAGVAVAALAATPAMAQDGPGDDVADIVITGSRIPQPNLVTTSPVTQVTGEDVDVAGVTRVEDLVNQLPQAFAAQNSTVSNGATGTATVSLRNLGADRTLVLIDGRRMGYGSPNDAASDLNQIPGQLVERVEVLTGGASAVYGSDALAGVVNFIMRRNFEGVQLDMQYGFYQHNNDYDGVGNLRNVITARGATNPAQFQLPDDNVMDGYSREVTLVLGTGTDDGRANITGYMSYRNNDYVIGGERDFSSCSLGGYAGSDFVCGGSGTSFPGRFVSANPTAGTIGGTAGVGTGTFIPYDGNLNAYNFGPLNYFQRPDERYSFGAFAEYNINDHVEVYADMMFTDYSSVAQIAPSGIFGNTSSINCGNPLLSAQQRTWIGCTAGDVAADNSRLFIPFRRNVEGGGRQDNIGYQNFRMVAGARGPINDFWAYDLYTQYSRVELQRTYANDFSVTRIQRALDVVSVGGVPTCRSVVDGSDPNCVPYNIFSPGGVTQAALDYLQIPLVQTGQTTQQIVSGSFTGDLGGYGMQSPWASRGVQVAFGAEYRREELNSVTDNAFATGDGAGQGGPTIGLNGSNDNYDLFLEAQVPIAEGQAWADQLSVDFAYRYSDYEFGGTMSTYKVGGDWAPIPDLRLRASFQHAVRAANIIELFQAQGLNLFDMDDDPCDMTDPNADGTAPVANCQGGAAWQVTAGEATGGNLTSPAGQYNFLAGGNPGLAPEEADTYTVGFVFQPSFIPGFNFSLDYFNIEVEQLISTVGALNTINACYFNNVAAACSLITRDTTLGTLWVGSGQVSDTNTNIGGMSTSGLDIAANYGVDLADWGMADYGSLNFSFVGTWLRSLEFDTGLGYANSVYDCAGFYANQCGVPNPEWRHRARVGWETPWNFELSGTWRYYGDVEIAVLGADGSLNNSPAARIDRTFDAENYFDLAGSWQVRDTTRLRAGVNNLLDNDPPLSYSVGTTGNNNTYPQLYDSMGRYFFFGLTQDF
jgi:outer membrane receptor protein involved in Fe transport